MAPHSAPTRQASRRGFTIIELLIVISIIAILLTLTVRVVGAFITAARESATQTTIRKIQGLISSRGEALHRLEMRSNFVESSIEYNNRPEVTQISNVNLKKILAKKLIAKRYFPQVYEDLALFDELNPSRKNKLSDRSKSSVSNPEILYEFLATVNVLGDPVGTDTFSSTEIADVDLKGVPQADGNPSFIDAWGKPLRFYRWPTRLFRIDDQSANNKKSAYWLPPPPPVPNSNVNPIDLTRTRLLFSTLPTFSGNIQSDLSRDPDDPLRLCTAFNPYKDSSAAPYDIDFERYGSGYHTPGTYHIMLIVSAGPDNKLGMFEPDGSSPGDVANIGRFAASEMTDTNSDAYYGYMEDNITYLNVRAGGK